MRDAATGRAVGSHFVEMATDEEATEGGDEFKPVPDGRAAALTVNEARPKPEFAGGGGGGGGNCGGSGGQREPWCGGVNAGSRAAEHRKLMKAWTKGDRVVRRRLTGAGTLVEVNEHHTVIDFAWMMAVASLRRD